MVRALQSARRPPAGSLSRLTWRQLAEAAAGTLGSASIDIDLLEAAAALVLCGASRIPVPLAPMLKAHGREAPTAIDRVGANLGLLASGEAAPGQPATLPPRPCPIPRAVGGGCQVWSAPGTGSAGDSHGRGLGSARTPLAPGWPDRLGTMEFTLGRDTGESREERPAWCL